MCTSWCAPETGSDHRQMVLRVFNRVAQLEGRQRSGRKERSCLVSAGEEDGEVQRDKEDGGREHIRHHPAHHKKLQRVRPAQSFARLLTERAGSVSRQGAHPGTSLFSEAPLAARFHYRNNTMLTPQNIKCRGESQAGQQALAHEHMPLSESSCDRINP